MEEGSETRCQGDHTGSFAGVPLCSAPSMDSSVSFYALFLSVSLGREERGTSPVSCNNECELAVLACVRAVACARRCAAEGRKEERKKGRKEGRKKGKVKRRARERLSRKRMIWWGRGRDSLWRCVPYREVDQCGQEDEYGCRSQPC
jgi:hypothetical protein